MYSSIMTLELLRRRFDLYSYLENKPKFIPSERDLEEVVKDFIQSEPKENEIIDVRVETLRERMNLQRGKTVAISSFTMRKKTS